MELIFASNNQHKLYEIKQMLGQGIEIVSAAQAGILDDIPETEKTLEGNALQKARYIYNKTGKSCFADDTGLEVGALNNAPGVYSARYAGPKRNPQTNMQKLLYDMRIIKDRTARFRTVIALIINGEEILFKGIVKGKIARTPKGEKGFGYDPIFIPNGYDITFAEMELDEKNKISHRAVAFQKLVQYIKKLDS